MGDRERLQDIVLDWCRKGKARKTGTFSDALVQRREAPGWGHKAARQTLATPDTVTCSVIRAKPVDKS